MTNFQLRYFKKYPGIKAYQNKQIGRVQTERRVETVLGRHRTFFGHPNDAATHRKAIAFDPQSTVGDMLNLGLWPVWYEMDQWGPGKWPLAAIACRFMITLSSNFPMILLILHNAYKQRLIVERVLELLAIELTFRDQTFSIPVEIECGWNWAPKKMDKTNVDGLIAWKPEGEARVRVYYRILPDWIDGFCEFARDPTLPQIFTTWTAISTIAAMLERRVFTFIRREPLFPNLYVLFVSPPGGGKSSTIGRATELVREVWKPYGDEKHKLKFAPDDITKASLIDFPAPKHSLWHR